MLKFTVQTAPFKEQPTADLNTTPHEFDLPAPQFRQLNGTDDLLTEYCHSLLFKLVSLNKSRIKPFLQYQCEQLSDPFVWLNKLEKLIDLNRENFKTKDHNIKIEKALVVIELLRQEIESGKNKISKFNFKKTKQQIQTFKTPEEKMSYLLEVKTEYLQNKPLVIDPTEVPFDVQCDLELNLLKTKRKLTQKKNTRLLTEEDGSPVNRVRSSPTRSKFKINSNVNVFVDVFYQLMHEKQVDGKPYLEATPNEIAELISESFKDKEGNVIPVDTIKTILKPSRFEKRPKGNARIEFN